MNQEKASRPVKFGLWMTQTRFGKSVLGNKTRLRISLFIFMLFTHCFYWLTAWWSPWPFIVFMALGVWFGQGILKPWGVIVNQAIQEHWDPTILKMAVPFIVLNWAAFFACLFMFTVVLDAKGVPIEGTWKHFYFSVVTLTTLGYGNLVPGNFWAELIATIEAIVGFMGFAIMAGIVASIVLKRAEFNEKA